MVGCGTGRILGDCLEANVMGDPLRAAMTDAASRIENLREVGGGRLIILMNATLKVVGMQSELSVGELVAKENIGLFRTHGGLAGKFGSFVVVVVVFVVTSGSSSR